MSKEPKTKELSRRAYEKKLRVLQAELCHAQEWVRTTGARIVIVFEGRDAAGKGGTIKAITEKLSPRVVRVVALPAPTDREKTQMYMQRYLPHFPAAGEVVIFDRSWYNRAGVEPVLGFCTPEEHREFLEHCPRFEQYLKGSGIQLLKYWLEVSADEQKARFEKRMTDPRRYWKLSPTDLESRRLWYRYSKARDQMLEATDTDESPWHIIRSDDKRRARLNCISHMLSLISYEKAEKPDVTMPERAKENEYDDLESIAGRRWIPEKF